MFDIESIYPSISEKHFNDSINFAKSTTLSSLCNQEKQ